MKKWIFPLAMTAALLSPASLAGDTVVYGPGADSCAEWLADQSEDGNYSLSMMRKSWVLGFITGVTFARSAIEWQETTNEAIFAFIDNWCRENPMKSISVASANLIKVLR